MPSARFCLLWLIKGSKFWNKQSQVASVKYIQASSFLPQTYGLKVMNATNQLYMLQYKQQQMKKTLVFSLKRKINSREPKEEKDPLC